MVASASSSQAKSDNTKKFKALEAAIKDVLPHVQEVLAISTHMEEAAQAKKSQKDAEDECSRQISMLKKEHSNHIAQMKDAQTKLVLEHQQQRRCFARSDEKLEENIEELKKKLGQAEKKKTDEHSKELKELSNKLQNTKNSMKRESAELEEMRITLGLTQQKLKIAEQEVASLHTTIGWREGESLDSAIEQLASELHRMGKTHIGKPFEPDIKTDEVFVQLNGSKFFQAIKRMVPISDSKASIRLRVAAAEGIIARELVHTVFHGAEVTAVPQGKLMETILKQFSTVAPRREAIFRSLLAEALDNEIKGGIQAAIQTAITEVMETLQPLLQALSVTQIFQEELEAFFQQASVVSRHLLRLQKKVEWSLEGKHPEKFVLYPENDVKSTSPPTPDMFNAVAHASRIVLFPQLVVHGTEDLLYHGFDLSPDQGISLMAHHEALKQASRVFPNRRPDAPSSRRRRQSSLYAP